MELKFVSEEKVAEITSRNESNFSWSRLVEELYKHPNQWIESPEKVNGYSQVAHLERTYKDIEARAAGGNRLPKDHPDKKKWTVFLRYVPTEETF